MKIIDIDSKKPHLSGKSKCARCNHEWVAVTPVGVVNNLECPKCGGTHGFLINPVLSAKNSVWTCDCGSNVFCIDPTGIYCWVCGEQQHF